MLEIITYTSSNGYSGKLFGSRSMVIYDPDGVMFFFTGHRGGNTLAYLQTVVDAAPDIESIIGG